MTDADAGLHHGPRVYALVTHAERPFCSVPFLLARRAFLETLHGPHVLAGPASHIATDGGTQRSHRRGIIVTIQRLRSTLDHHLEAAAIGQTQAVQEHAIGRTTLEQARYEFAGQCRGAEEGHEYPALHRRLRIGRYAHRTAAAHLPHDADDAVTGGGGHLVAQLGALFLQQFIHCLQFRRPIEDDRRTLLAVPVVEHFPVAQVAGDAHHALAF